MERVVSSSGSDCFIGRFIIVRHGARYEIPSGSDNTGWKRTFTMIEVLQ